MLRSGDRKSGEDFSWIKLGQSVGYLSPLALFLPRPKRGGSCSFSSANCSASLLVEMPKYLRLVVAGGSCVGKTALIEQAVFGKHSPGQVSERSPCYNRPVNPSELKIWRWTAKIWRFSENNGRFYKLPPYKGYI